ncbi:MAG: hypothetical protein CNLJKLNK_00435 [Holosporales bacterium]
MKKNFHFKTKGAITAFALSATLLNAVEQNLPQTESPSLHCHEPTYGFSRPKMMTKYEIIRELSKGNGLQNIPIVICELSTDILNKDKHTEKFLNMVNQLSQGMNDADKKKIIKELEDLDPDHFTDAFVNTVNQLSQGMNSDDKAKIICSTGNISPDRYTDAFINTVNKFTQGMEVPQKAWIIWTTGNLPLDLYTDAFINIINQLSQRMDGYNKAKVINVVSNIHPDRYTDAFFINTVNQLSQGMDGNNKMHVIEAVAKVHPHHYPFLQNFSSQNPTYFRYVRAEEFRVRIRANMTQQQLEDCLQNLHREYYNQAPAGTPQSLAFEIHNFSNQRVIGQTGQQQPFNAAVLNHIQRSIQGPMLGYEIVLDLLRAKLATLKNDPLKSDAINEAVYNWVIQSNAEPQNKDAIALVVTYLEQKDNTHQKLATWLYAFMDESKNAYNNKQNSQSCTKGVKERVITSLRSALPEGDSALENLFHQAEATFMLATKSKRLTDYAFWAEKLLQKGITSSTQEMQAKDKFNEALVEFFGMREDAKEIVQATLDAFNDFENSTDGLWSKIKPELLKIEQGPEKNRTSCSIFKGFLNFVGKITSSFK